ncbi:MAG: PspC domain-containing protein [Corynebacterium sp.]|uniref:PspC domain-containing protein n=1 Tax=Corynebacterium sp. TaxID=1720 RepID=UPI0026DC3611|nr:PspC domain-containing protein [Corynebacterium sp.]MDO5029698.1 PspC domain-containing protein [Corynebacterium sp.]
MTEPNHTSKSRKIARSRNDRIIAGVLAGLAESQGWDVGFTRTVFVVLPIVGSLIGWEIGVGFLAIYLLAWFVLPNGKYTLDDDSSDKNSIENIKREANRSCN